MLSHASGDAMPVLSGSAEVLALGAVAWWKAADLTLQCMTGLPQCASDLQDSSPCHFDDLACISCIDKQNEQTGTESSQRTGWSTDYFNLARCLLQASLSAHARHNDAACKSLQFPTLGRAQKWMLQTVCLLSGTDGRW